MSNKYCRKYRELIMEKLDGEIKENDNIQLEFHLKACEDCRLYYSQIESMKKAIGSLLYDIPPFMEEKIMSKITEKTYKKSVFSFHFGRIFAYAASFGLVFFVSLFFIYNKFDNKIVSLPDIPVITAEIPVSHQEKNIKNIELPIITQKSVEIKKEEAKQEDFLVELQKNPLYEQGQKIANSEFVEEKTQVKPIQDYNVKKIDSVKPGIEAAKATPIPPVPYNPLLEKDKAIVANNVINPLQGQSAIIRFIVDDTAFVKITIYDKNIRPVSKILNEEKGRGIYEATWAGKNDNNEIVSEGVYFVYIQIGTRVIKKSIIVNK